MVLELEGQRLPLSVEPSGSRTWVVSIYGDRREVVVMDERTERARRLRSGSGAERTVRPLLAPMPGLVVRVPAAAGQAVEEGSSLVVLEAMKMENDLKAAAPATVEQVHVRPGQPVEKGDLLISFRETPPSA
jgi:pyruvate carboxylase subunit B